MELKDKILALTNNDKRREFVRGWESWPVWVTVPQLGLTVFRIDLPDGSAICASLFEAYNTPTGHISPHYCILQYPGHEYRPANEGITTLIEHLAEVRKKLAGVK